MTATDDAVRPEEQEVLTAFREYHSAFLRGAVEDLSAHVSLPFFDLRDGEIAEMRSEAQLVGFRRGLLARLATLGVMSPALGQARVLMAGEELALVQFEYVSHAADGPSRGGAKSVAFMRREGHACWRAWMVSGLPVHESESVRKT
jgi:hypothetical protein